jgi:predicted amino acid dehydrogenase
MKTSFRIAEIRVGEARWDSSYSFTLGDPENQYDFQVESYGLDLAAATGPHLMRKLMTQVDAIALSGFPPTVNLGERSFTHRQYLELLQEPSSIIVSTGEHPATLAVVEGLNRAIESGAISPQNGVFFPSGLLEMDAVRTLDQSFKDHLYFGDAFAFANIPVALRGSGVINTFGRLAVAVGNIKDLKNSTYNSKNIFQSAARKILKEQLHSVQNIYASLGYLARLGDDLGLVTGKTIITPSGHPRIEALIQSFKPKSIVSLFPASMRFSDEISYSVVEAAIRLKHGKYAPLSLFEWEKLTQLESKISFATRRYLLAKKPSADVRINHLVRQARRLFRKPETPDFAFIVHCLSAKDLALAPGLGVLKNMPRSTLDSVERLAAKAPGFVLGRINNVISQTTGDRVNGLIYALLSTPRMMRSQPVEEVYDKIHKVTLDAAERGAKIIGLGAYTKVIGDSGQTIHRSSPIPVTTGNSLSASATLWAVHEAVKKMGLLSVDPISQRIVGRATVVGATGSIGRVSAKLLSLVFSELTLVAPQETRLSELASEITQMSPTCRVTYTTDANTVAAVTDVLVTATSSFDQKIIDVDLLKPGCVVCDCSRPLDFSVEDALRRPDVLIIESGEVILPGPYSISCDLGLPDNIVYACLGETVLLSLERRYEPFTLGRNLDWEKVKEIYRLAQKHGVKLATIRGHAGYIRDKEIQIVRELALKARQNRSAARPGVFA